ncbi:hypothetical protein [Allosphingosinicella indica]|uniref:Uncharacterized protein n=1 Tax=Allosphingosinicella indica TaxID=941907 RepID=A0A1X7FYK3_9SPHN|nr:hypothetical protein [Allosphingosinicella indica]SMF61175.1 hypothetical protein SAMN06295910_0157 [Allosphingosinicella indica]
MAHDYGLYLREEIFGARGWQATDSYDLFLSAFNLGERTVEVYGRIGATEKIWLIHEEYGLSGGEVPDGQKFQLAGSDEAIYCNALIDSLLANGQLDVARTRLCIDITGILRPHLLFITLYLKRLGVRVVDMLYAEPKHYALKEKTPFSTGSILEVRPVRGFEGASSMRGGEDFLVIGMGYDDRLLAAVAENKDKAEKHQLFGLPSLRADMYQESVLRSRRAADELGDSNFSETHRSFAPANDPFGTASVLGEIIEQRLARQPDTSLMLCPLGTKAQVLGFALYHIFEGGLLGARIVFPFSEGYSPKTGTDMARAWLYRVEL